MRGLSGAFTNLLYLAGILFLLFVIVIIILTIKEAIKQSRVKNKLDEVLQKLVQISKIETGILQDFSESKVFSASVKTEDLARELQELERMSENMANKIKKED